jgi:hypothetical protein
MESFILTIVRNESEEKDNRYATVKEEAVQVYLRMQLNNLFVWGNNSGFR